ncbi:MAG: aldehyde:ferredoxin oxidoreductase [Thermoplasmata archaeon]|nr:MAG: aldehyde:ferredoxin oxidoreductase [Thermoplasmata archaeon]
MLKRVLNIDLTNETYKIEEMENLFTLFLGGIGTGIRLLERNCPESTDSNSENAPIIFCIGTLEGLFPCCSKTAAVFKSPLTGNLGESYAGGKLGLAMRFADYGAIVIKGKAKRSTYISIHNEDVKFHNATTLKGLSTYATARVLREVEKRKGIQSIVTIGPAGERLIRYANVNVDTYRHFGRLGLGAVFGSKNLKAITISGNQSYEIDDKKTYKTVYRAIYDILINTPIMQKYHDLGTSVNILPLNELRCLPTRNLQTSSFEGADKISGELFASEYLTKKIACGQCPIGCIHIATIRIPFGSEHEYESMKVPYDYEPLFSLGTMLGISSPEEVMRLIEIVDGKGLDAMSTGVILAWATEAYEHGLISAKETMGIPLYWGKGDNYRKIIENLVNGSNEFYKILSTGVLKASGIFGGHDYALELGRNEIAGYHCGYATILGQLYGGRHSHLDNGGYALDQKLHSNPMEPEKIVETLILEEQGRCVFNSLVACLFARGMYTDKIISDALEVAGIKRTPEELAELGELIYTERFKFKIREGFDLDNLKIPKRFYETESFNGMLNEKNMEKLAEIYRERIKGLL